MPATMGSYGYEGYPYPKYPQDPVTYSRQLTERTGDYLTPVNIIFTLLALVAWSLRVTSRLFLLKNKGLDDLFVTIAYIICVIIFALQYDSGSKGLGRHYWTFFRDENTTFLKRTEDMWRNLWITEEIFNIAAACSKISVLCFFLRLADADPGRRLFRKLVHATMAFVCIWSTTIFILMLCVCRPISLNWIYGTDWEERCWPYRIIGAIVFSQSALSALSDLIVCFLPTKTVLEALSQNTLGGWGKARIAVLPFIGLIACLIGVGRLYPLYLYFHDDPAWHLPVLYATVTMELNLTIICACLPFCKHPIQWLLGKRTPAGSVVYNPEAPMRRAGRGFGISDIESGWETAPRSPGWSITTFEKAIRKSRSRSGSIGLGGRRISDAGTEDYPFAPPPTAVVPHSRYCGPSLHDNHSARNVGQKMETLTEEISIKTQKVDDESMPLSPSLSSCPSKDEKT